MPVSFTAPTALSTRTVLPAQIIFFVSREYRLSKKQLLSRRRPKGRLEPRWALAYLLHSLRPEDSFPEIGKHFGKRHHSTVMYLIRKAEAVMEHDSFFANRVRRLENELLVQGRELQIE